MAKLLVTGASGFLGWRLCQVAQQRNWQVCGTYGTHAIALPGVELAAVDLRDAAVVEALIDRWEPDGVIHAAAQARPALCQQQPAATYPINVQVPEAIAALCASRSIPFVFTSTDQVFDGLKGWYREADPVSPVSVYGQQKAEAEQRILAVYSKAIVARMPLMFGEAPGYATSFLQDFLSILRAGQPLNLFTDEYRTPVSNTTAAHGLLIALEKGQGGLLHLGGKERLSRYEFGRKMVEVFELSPALIHPCTQASVPTGAPRSPDTSMDSTTAFVLGYAPPSIDDELNALKGKV